MKIALTLLFTLLTCTLQAGTYLEYKFTHLINKNSAKQKQDFDLASMNNTVKIWYSDGNSRSEIEMGKTQGAGEEPAFLLPKNLISLTLKSDQTKTYSLNEATKTYTVIDLNKFKADDLAKPEDYTITEIGRETVNGYLCVHVSVKEKGKKFLNHWWISKAVKGYQELKKTNGKIKDGLSKALEARNLDGMMVRMRSEEGIENGEVQMDLVKIEEMNIPASKFSLDGYTLSQNALSPLLGGPAVDLSEEEKKIIVEAAKGDVNVIQTMENLLKNFPVEQRSLMLKEIIKGMEKKD